MAASSTPIPSSAPVTLPIPTQQQIRTAAIAQYNAGRSIFTTVATGITAASMAGKCDELADEEQKKDHKGRDLSKSGETNCGVEPQFSYSSYYYTNYLTQYGFYADTTGLTRSATWLRTAVALSLGTPEVKLARATHTMNKLMEYKCVSSVYERTIRDAKIHQTVNDELTGLLLDTAKIRHEQGASDLLLPMEFRALYKHLSTFYTGDTYSWTPHAIIAGRLSQLANDETAFRHLFKFITPSVTIPTTLTEKARVISEFAARATHHQAYFHASAGDMYQQLTPPTAESLGSALGHYERAIAESKAASELDKVMLKQLFRRILNLPIPNAALIKRAHTLLAAHCTPGELLEFVPKLQDVYCQSVTRETKGEEKERPASPPTPPTAAEDDDNYLQNLYLHGVINAHIAHQPIPAVFCKALKANPALALIPKTSDLMTALITNTDPAAKAIIDDAFALEDVAFHMMRNNIKPSAPLYWRLIEGYGTKKQTVHNLRLNTALRRELYFDPVAFKWLLGKTPELKSSPTNPAEGFFFLHGEGRPQDFSKALKHFDEGIRFAENETIASFWRFCAADLRQQMAAATTEPTAKMALLEKSIEQYQQAITFLNAQGRTSQADIVLCERLLAKTRKETHPKKSEHLIACLLMTADAYYGKDKEQAAKYRKEAYQLSQTAELKIADSEKARVLDLYAKALIASNSETLFNEAKDLPHPGVLIHFANKKTKSSDVAAIREGIEQLKQAFRLLEAWPSLAEKSRMLNQILTALPAEAALPLPTDTANLKEFSEIVKRELALAAIKAWAREPISSIGNLNRILGTEWRELRVDPAAHPGINDAISIIKAYEDALFPLKDQPHKAINGIKQLQHFEKLSDPLATLLLARIREHQAAQTRDIDLQVGLRGQALILHGLLIMEVRECTPVLPAEILKDMRREAMRFVTKVAEKEKELTSHSRVETTPAKKGDKETTSAKTSPAKKEEEKEKETEAQTLKRIAAWIEAQQITGTSFESLKATAISAEEAKATPEADKDDEVTHHYNYLAVTSEEIKAAEGDKRKEMEICAQRSPIPPAPFRQLKASLTPGDIKAEHVTPMKIVTFLLNANWSPFSSRDDFTTFTDRYPAMRTYALKYLTSALGNPEATALKRLTSTSWLHEKFEFRTVENEKNSSLPARYILVQKVAPTAAHSATATVGAAGQKLSLFTTTTVDLTSERSLSLT